MEILPDDPFKILEKTIGEPYREEVGEKRAIEWLVGGKCPWLTQSSCLHSTLEIPGIRVPKNYRGAER